MRNYRPADVYRPTGRVYARTGHLSHFNSGDGQDLENQLLDFFRETNDLSAVTEELHPNGHSWPMRYYLSVQRVNLLRPFVEYFPHKDILEIGSDGGILTRYLAECKANVVALENNFKHAEITAERCRDLENVTVINDHFAQFECTEKFDVIIVAGGIDPVGDHTADDLLIKINSLLKKDGMLLLALDNKLGLKYWAGIPEQSSGIAYAGIENRHAPGRAFSYGKMEIQTLLQNAGFTNNEFYFPFPDHKFPSIILKEKALEAPGFNIADLLLSNLDYVQNNWYAPGFSLERAIRQVIKNGLTAHLANSFLIIAQKKQQVLTNDSILAWSYSAQRKRAYRKENIFRWEVNQQIMVEKKQMYPQAVAEPHAHVQQYINNEPYIDGNIYFQEFIDIISTPGWSVSKLVDWAFPYYKLLLSLSQKQGNEWYLYGKYVDLTPFNILVNNQGHLHIFDQEWRVNGMVPLSFVLFRGLYYCLAKPLSYYPPEAGTPLFAFELIQKIMAAFCTPPLNMIDDFIEREHDWFSPISLFSNRPPKNFELRIIPEQVVAEPLIRNGIPIAPLQTIRSKIFIGQQVYEQIIGLLAKPVTYAINIHNPAEKLQKISLRLAEQPGLIQFHTIKIKDERGVVLFTWDGSSDDDIELTDTLLIKDNTGGNTRACLLLSNDPMIVFALPETFRNSTSSTFAVELELSVMDKMRSEWLADNMNNLLPLLRYSAMYKNGADARLTGQAEGIQQLITGLVSDVVQPLEIKIAKSIQEISLLEEQVAEQEKEIALLQKAVRMNSAVSEENTRLQQTIDWFVRTYELRSLPGLLKDRLQKVFKDTYTDLLNRVIETNFIKRKYAAEYLLKYARDNGPWQFGKATLRAVNEHGINSIMQCKRIVRAKMQSNASPIYAVRRSQDEAFDKRKLEQEMSRWQSLPTISIILPVYNTKPALLQAAIVSVQDQVYENWELCIADDASTEFVTKEMLYSFRDDPRIKIVWMEENAGISQASNRAIQVSTGEFLALMDHDDELAPDALYWIAKEINTYNNVDIIYTDECKIDEKGQLSDHFRKPDWSPELLLNMMYPGHLTVYRKDFLSRVGFFRKQFDFSQDYDLMLRASESTAQIRHIPRILYHWRLTEGSASLGGKPYARHTNLAALADAMRQRGIAADIIDLPTANRVQLRQQFNTRVSVIVPTDSFDNLKATLESITGNTSYPDYEIVVVTNSGLIKAMQRDFSFSRVKYVPYDLPYNFSDKCNVGAEQASGEVLVFFNDDVRPLQANWVENTIEYLWLPGVGGVSPKLLYENDTIQYAGMATGVRNLTGTTFHCYPKDATAYFNFAQSVRNISVLSGACLAIRKVVFTEIGGFDHVNTPSSHSDVDLSFKLLEMGLRCVYTPYAVLRHIGHLSLAVHERKELKKDKADIYLLRRWVKYLGEDPYFTRPMRELLYHDSPEPYNLFVPATQRKFGNKGDIMLVCHDLSLSGAPIMLFDICRILLANGYFVVVCCATDGPLRRRYQQLGVTVITDALVLQQHPSFYRFAKNFDAIICNTVVTWPVVKQMQQTVKTIWWLQEAKVVQMFMGDPEFVRTLRQAKNIISVSEYAISYIKEYNPQYTKIYNASDDFCGALTDVEKIKEQKDTLIFSIIGSIEHRKGQDVLIDALTYLKEEVLQRVEIHIIGRTLDEQFRKKLNEKTKDNDRVRFLGEMSHEDSINYLFGSDVIISASRDDPFPVVLVEALCMGKTCIVSDRTGLAELIEEGKNGFVFENEDARGLAKKMAYIAKNPGMLQRVGAEARITYEKYLTLALFEKKLLNYLNNVTELGPKNKIRQESRLTTIESEG